MQFLDVHSQNEDDSYILENKCATFHPHRNTIIKDRKLAEITELSRPVMQKSFPSQSGKFLIHYDTTGFNAVSPKDENHNSISDYIDSVSYYLDYVYQKEVTEMGYLQPASDNGLGGSDAFDIYVVNIGVGDINQAGMYGYTVPETELPGSKPNRIRSSSYIVIDNDFSSLDSSYTPSKKKYRTFYDTSYTALKITIAHEFHHAIQFMYGEDPTAPAINEMTSTWFEYRLFPETKDYYQYLKFLFKNPGAYPFGKGISDTGYLYGILGQYLHNEFGDEVLRRMWEIIADGSESYDALNKALIEKNTSLASEWCKFDEWLYYTGDRAKPGFGFDSAAMFPQVTFYSDLIFQSPSFTNSAGLLSFEFRFFRMKFPKEDINATPDVLDILATNTDLKSAVYQSEYDMPYTLSIVDKSMPDYSQIGETNYFFKLDMPKGNICYTPILSNGIITRAICHAYPNPFIENKYQSILFPAPHDKQIGNSVRIRLYNSVMENILSVLKTVSVDNGNRVLIVDSSELTVPSGVYIFEVGDNQECSGKIAIIKSK